MMTLTRYCAPIRSTPVDKVDTEAVLSILKPLWMRAPQTASRLRGRVERVLNEFLHRRRRPLDHLARGDAVDKQRIESANRHGAQDLGETIALRRWKVETLRRRVHEKR